MNPYEPMSDFESDQFDATVGTILKSYSLEHLSRVLYSSTGYQVSSVTIGRWFLRRDVPSKFAIALSLLPDIPDDVTSLLCPHLGRWRDLS